jgi:hypothetical protein
VRYRDWRTSKAAKQVEELYLDTRYEDQSGLSDGDGSFAGAVFMVALGNRKLWQERKGWGSMLSWSLCGVLLAEYAFEGSKNI